jgi:hypothetical protein
MLALNKRKPQETAHELSFRKKRFLVKHIRFSCHLAVQVAEASYSEPEAAEVAKEAAKAAAATEAEAEASAEA